MPTLGQWSQLFHKPLITIGGVQLSLANLLIASLLLVVVGFVARKISGLVEKRLSRRTDTTELGAKLIARWVAVGIWVVGLVAVADLLNVRLTSLSFFAGALGIGIGFGLQTIVNNFISGLLILTERTMKTGDIISVGGETGRLIHIGARASVLQTGKGSVIAVPNTQFINGPVVNWTVSGQGVAVTIPFSVSTYEEGERAEECALQLARSHPLVLSDPGPKVYLTRIGDILAYELVVWVEDPIEKPRLVQNDINRALIQSLREKGILVRG